MKTKNKWKQEYLDNQPSYDVEALLSTPDSAKLYLKCANKKLDVELENVYGKPLFSEKTANKVMRYAWKFSLSNQNVLWVFSGKDGTTCEVYNYTLDTSEIESKVKNILAGLIKDE